MSNLTLSHVGPQVNIYHQAGMETRSEELHHNCNMVSAELCASGLQNARCTRESQHVSVVKQDQKGQQTGQRSQKGQQN